MTASSPIRFMNRRWRACGFSGRRSCDLIIAVGGGSAMDVAKCIKLYAYMDPGINYLEQKIVPNDIPLLAVPTTAGTGSEATRYAVVYYKGEKQSVCDESCIPSAVLMDASVLKTRPLSEKGHHDGCFLPRAGILLVGQFHPGEQGVCPGGDPDDFGKQGPVSGQ